MNEEWFDLMEQSAIEAHLQEFESLLNGIGPQHLNHYVYILRGPRDGKVFYVGQGTNARVLAHLREAIAVEYGAQLGTQHPAHSPDTTHRRNPGGRRAGQSALNLPISAPNFAPS